MFCKKIFFFAYKYDVVIYIYVCVYIYIYIEQALKSLALWKDKRMPKTEHLKHWSETSLKESPHDADKWLK